MRPACLDSCCQTHGEPEPQATLFTQNEVLAVRVGEMDLEKATWWRRSFVHRRFEGPRNPLADCRLEALRALVVRVGVAHNQDVLEAACVAARDAGLSETQIAFIVARHRNRKRIYPPR